MLTAWKKGFVCLWKWQWTFIELATTLKNLGAKWLSEKNYFHALWSLVLYQKRQDISLFWSVSSLKSHEKPGILSKFACTILYLIFDIVGRVTCHLNNYNTLLSALDKAVLCALWLNNLYTQFWFLSTYTGSLLSSKLLSKFIAYMQGIELSCTCIYNSSIYYSPMHSRSIL